MFKVRNLILVLACSIVFFNCREDNGKNSTGRKEIVLTNVSYDPTREMYQEINKEFAALWEKQTGQVVKINQSHGGSGKQARSVIDGLEADVVTLALAYDIDAISSKAHLIAPDWQKRLPHNSSPYNSTIIFLVRKGNPKQIRDWNDLVRDGVSVITPNPKTSGGARWNYLAAWAYASEKFNGDENKIKEFISKLLRNVPVFDSGARGSTNTFVQRNMGDVLIAWENEAMLVASTIGKGNYDIVIPSMSILAEPPVAVVDKVADKKGTKKIAEAYLKFLYSARGQEIAAKHFYRPTSDSILSKSKSQFKSIRLINIDEFFGGWKQAQKKHFDDGGTFDQLTVR